MSIIKEKVKPCKSRELFAEILPGAHNWKEFYEQYGIYIGGLVKNPFAKDQALMNANHCWRFVRRGDTRLNLKKKEGFIFNQ